MAPASRGTVTLTAVDPEVPPAVDPGFLREPADTARLAAGLALLRQAAASPAFAPLGLTEAWPGPGTGDDGLPGWGQADRQQLLAPSGHLPHRTRSRTTATSSTRR